MKDAIFELKFEKKDLKVIIEAGHIYTDHKMSYSDDIPGPVHGPELNVGVDWGSLISKYLTVFGVTVEKWVFVDDYNPKFEGKPSLFDKAQYLKFLFYGEFPPDKMVFESHLEYEAKNMLDYLVKNLYAGKNHDGKFVLSKDNILLYDPAKNKFSCSILDACLYETKMKNADACITVLEKQYTHQQKSTMTILKKMGIDSTMIFPFFFHVSNWKMQEMHESVAMSNIYASDNTNCVHINGETNGKSDSAYINYAIKAIKPKDTSDVENLQGTAKNNNGDALFLQNTLDLIRTVHKLSGKVYHNSSPFVYQPSR